MKLPFSWARFDSVLYSLTQLNGTLKKFAKHSDRNFPLDWLNTCAHTYAVSNTHKKNNYFHANYLHYSIKWFISIFNKLEIIQFVYFIYSVSSAWFNGNYLNFLLRLVFHAALWLNQRFDLTQEYFHKTAFRKFV